MNVSSTWYQKTLLGLGILFLVVNIAYLHRVPGLMGDEASEGQNVFELHEREGLTLQGERSYIGPLIDYIRAPFIAVFGYTALGMRVPMLLFSLFTFLLAASVLRRWFGEEVSLFPLVAMAFSLVYLTQQRLGWAIVLFPFFFFLTVWLAQRDWPYKWVFVGLAAGLGLHTHIMFLPTLAALFVAGIVAGPVTYFVRPANSAGNGRDMKKIILNIFLTAISFWAGFGTQFVVLQLFPEDQGDPLAVAEVMSERVAALPDLLPLLISGSSYAARYTGVEFSPVMAQVITWVVGALALAGIVLGWRKKVIWLWVVGLTVQLTVLLYMIDRFTLRYFIMFVLGLYILAGVGAGELIVRSARRVKRPWFIPLKVAGMAGVLSLIWVWLILIPFLRTGGSLADFSLGNRTDSAAAVVDVRPLLACLRGAGSVSSDNIHIYNRLLYLSHEYEDLVVIPEEMARRAEYLVRYRLLASSAKHELCPGLRHFVVESNN